MQKTKEFYENNREYFEELEELYGYDLEPFKDYKNVYSTEPETVLQPYGY